MSTPLPTDRELTDFVYAEARLLDELRFEDWLALFAEDGVYWMPLAPGQTDARLHASLMHEDKLLLQVRVEHADTADEMFSKLMGDVVEPRREFIQENALEAEVDA